MTERVFHVLFLCTGNSARSILAEALLERLGAPRFRGFSAGSHPKDAPHPVALAILSEKGFDTEGLRSKSWDDFAAPGAPEIDLVITVCDSAAKETCPIWSGSPSSAHWSLEDPAGCEGGPESTRQRFEKTFDELESRIDRLVRLDVAELGRDALARRAGAIGSSDAS